MSLFHNQFQKTQMDLKCQLCWKMTRMHRRKLFHSQKQKTQQDCLKKKKKQKKQQDCSKKKKK